MLYISNMDTSKLNDGAIWLELARRLRATRLSLNLSQQEVSVKTGINRSMIAGLENGSRSISMSTFIKLMRAYQRLDLVLDCFESGEIRLSPKKRFELEAKKQQRKRPKL